MLVGVVMRRTHPLPYGFTTANPAVEYHASQIEQGVTVWLGMREWFGYRGFILTEKPRD